MSNSQLVYGIKIPHSWQWPTGLPLAYLSSQIDDHNQFAGMSGRGLGAVLFQQMDKPPAQKAGVVG